MTYNEFSGILFPPMEALGYKKVNETNWILRMQEITVVSGMVFYVTEPRFDIELGVLFNRFNTARPWEKSRLQHANIRTKLYTLLDSFGESTLDLDKLFHWPENDEAAIENNISAICELYQKKVMPYFDQFNDYSFLRDNFDKKIVRKPFEVKLYPVTYYTEIFTHLSQPGNGASIQIKPSTEEELFNSAHARANAEEHKVKAAQLADTVTPSEDIYAVVNGLELFTAETIAILTESGQEWHDKWPIGEPMYSRNDGYQFVLHSNQVQQVLRIGIRKAQDMLRETRKFLGKGADDYVSVKEFCQMYKYDEEDFRKALRDIKPDFSIR